MSGLEVICERPGVPLDRGEADGTEEEGTVLSKLVMKFSGNGMVVKNIGPTCRP